MEENGRNVDILNEDIMMERGKFTANGYTFTVKPVYLGEEDEYFSDMTISPIPKQEEGDDEPTDKDLSRWAIALFSSKVNGIEKPHRRSVLSRILGGLLHRNDYRYYSDRPAVMPLIKWLERKVFYKGRRIKFYQLERKFGLNKSEIEQLIIYFHELSGF